MRRGTGPPRHVSRAARTCRASSSSSSSRSCRSSRALFQQPGRTRAALGAGRRGQSPPLPLARAAAVACSRGGCHGCRASRRRLALAVEKKSAASAKTKLGLLIACKPQLCSAGVCFARGQVLPPARHTGDGEGQQGAAGRHATAATSAPGPIGPTSAPGPIGPTSAPGPIGPTSAPGLCRHAVRRRRFLAPQAAALVRHTGARAVLCRAVLRRAVLCRAVLCQRILVVVSVVDRRVRVCFQSFRSTWLSCDMLRCLATCCAVMATLRCNVPAVRCAEVPRVPLAVHPRARQQGPDGPSQPIRSDPSRSDSAPHPVPAQMWARPGADVGVHHPTPVVLRSALFRTATPARTLPAGYNRYY
jgi:hypothetical protein